MSVAISHFSYTSPCKGEVGSRSEPGGGAHDR
jgi:hypothetical protein